MFYEGKENSGFSLIELLVALCITSIVIISIYNLFTSQNKSFVVQEQITGMQQDLRAALLMMVKEIRMAGYDPLRRADAGFIDANSNSIGFTFDLNSDGNCVGPDETISYTLSAENSLERNDQLMAENIQGLEFYYTLDDDSQTLSPADPDKIRLIQITVLVRVAQSDEDFTNEITYTTASNASWGPFNDGFRRRLLTTTLKCRNMGL